MRARVVLAVLAAGSGAVACFDLFHSTDFDTLCVADPGACADGGDGAPGDGPINGGDGSNDDGSNSGDGGTDGDGAIPPTDFCNWDATTSHEAARRACALLGACRGPYGNNEFGKCFENALRAFDCAMNPSFPLVIGSNVHRYWDCLQKARTCDDVTRCVFPSGDQSCTVASSVVCAASARMDCVTTGAPLATEACIAVGQTCGSIDGLLECAATSGDAGCKPLGCEGSFLRDCVGQAERGRDCTSYGARACKDMALTTDAGADAALSTCAPSPDGGACTPSPNVTCVNGLVSACFTGTLETFDCRALMEGVGGACDKNIGGSDPIWDLARYCVANGACTESCDAGTLIGCHRGNVIAVDCKTYVGSTQCVPDPINTGHPACAKP